MNHGFPIIQFLRPRNTLVFFASLAIVLGAFTHNAHLLGFAAFCLTAVAMAFHDSWGLLKSVKVSRHHHPRAFQFSSVAVSLRLVGEDGRSPELVVVEDVFPPSTTPRVRRLVEYPLTPGRVVEIGFVGQCNHRRGLYVLGPVRLQAYDALGFFPRELTMDLFTELLVYPQAVDLQRTQLLGDGTLAHVGLEMSRRTGMSEEFLGVRDYRPGDSPRLIHWKSTARHRRLMVKEFQEELTTLVTFFLDLGRLGLVGVGDQTSVEYGIKCCASLAKRTVELGHRLQFFGVADKVEHIPPGSGTTHLLTVLDRLSFLKPQGDSAFAIVLADLARTLPRGSTAVSIMGATTIDFEAIRPAVALMLHRSVLPIFILIDDRAFIKIYREQEDRHVQALPLEQIVKHLNLMGARVHVIRRAKSMEQALLQGLEQESHT